MPKNKLFMKAWESK